MLPDGFTAEQIRATTSQESNMRDPTINIAMNNELEIIEKIRILPVIAIHDAQKADALASALVEGGLPCAEITFRTDAAADAIKLMARRKDIQVGAGTVLKIDQVKTAVDAGASFMVSPGFNPKVVGYCVDNQIPIVPGIANPTDIEMALEFGLKVLKFFPAEAFGGLKTLKAMSAPYGMIKFIPTGGINTKNVREYLKHPKVLACGGAWMVLPDWIQKGDFKKIKEETQKAVQLTQSI